MDSKWSKLAISSALLSILGFYSGILGLLAIILGVVALYKIKRSQGLLKGRFLAIVGIIIGALVFLLTTIVIMEVRSHFRSFKIPSDAMSPAIKKGDRIFVDRKAYVAEMPKRGDIIVFYDIENREKLIIKRIVGLPEEELEIKDGKLYINGKVVQEPEEFKNINYLNKGSYGKEGDIVKIPIGSYFVLGDNSAVSRDSRYYGPINKNDIYGKVVIKYDLQNIPIKRIKEMIESSLFK